ncbi:MAG TPA: efflux RND transporter permease subunit, partial [Spirochaetota bacterium]
EQQLRDKVANARPKLPSDIQEPVFVKRDLSSLPIVRLSLQSDLPATKAYDLANEEIKLQIQQINNVGDVEIVGGRRREIQVELDRDKLNLYRIPASTVVNQLGSAGVNVPAGKFEKGHNETVFRTMGEFENLKAIGDSVILFSGDISNSVTVKDLGKVIDGAEDTTTLGYIYYPYTRVSAEEAGKKKGFFAPKITEVRDPNATTRPSLFLDVFKQSGSNTVAVADAIKTKIEKINLAIADRPGHPRLEVVSDYSKSIKANVDDVEFTIFFGVLLAIFTVYIFLGNLRSTIITGIAIPTSLLGAFILMYLAGFTLNLMSLMALSLAVGLLIDDAIVIQENIYRKREAKMHPFAAAEFGTEEVKLAVIATTLVVISVFMPVGFLSGTIGGYFRPFAFSIVFAMAISLGAALTVAPLLNAYFGGKGEKNHNPLIKGFDKIQDVIDYFYEKILNFTLGNPWKVLLATLLIFIMSIVMVSRVPKTFQPEGDSAEFNLSIELPSGTSLDGTHSVIEKIEPKLKKIHDIKYYTIVIGNSRGETNKATIGIVGLPRKERQLDTNGMKQLVRKEVKEFSYANPEITNSW